MRLGDDDANVLARTALDDATVAVNPGGDARVGGDKERFSRFDGAEYSAGEMHIEFAGSPKPAVIRHVEQDVRFAAFLSQHHDMTSDQMRDHAFIADVR